MTSFFPDHWLDDLPEGAALLFCRYTQPGLLRLLTNNSTPIRFKAAGRFTTAGSATLVSNFTPNHVTSTPRSALRLLPSPLSALPNGLATVTSSPSQRKPLQPSSLSIEHWPPKLEKIMPAPSSPAAPKYRKAAAINAGLPLSFPTAARRDPPPALGSRLCPASASTPIACAPTQETSGLANRAAAPPPGAGSHRIAAPA